MLRGGWYPVVRMTDVGAVLSIEGREFDVGVTYLELSDTPRDKAVWGFPVGDAGMLGVVAVCPEGHHNAGLGPSQTRYLCGWCGREWEILKT